MTNFTGNTCHTWHLHSPLSRVALVWGHWTQGAAVCIGDCGGFPAWWTPRMSPWAHSGPKHFCFSSSKWLLLPFFLSPVCVLVALFSLPTLDAVGFIGFSHTRECTEGAWCTPSALSGRLRTFPTLMVFRVCVASLVKCLFNGLCVFYWVLCSVLPPIALTTLSFPYLSVREGMLINFDGI